METEGQFRVIDPETGKPRPKGTEEYTETEFQAWKRLPIWKRWRLTFAPGALITVGLVLAVALQRLH